MATADFISRTFRDFHQALDNSSQDLSLEQLHFRPDNKGNHIAFIVWHYARTEDNIISALQQRESIWQSGGWSEKLGLPERAQGTGMSVEDASSVSLSDLSAFREYLSQVWQKTEEYMASLQDADLEKTVTIGRMVDRPVINLIGNVLLTHGYTHLGEAGEIRCLML